MSRPPLDGLRVLTVSQFGVGPRIGTRAAGVFGGGLEAAPS